MRSGVGGVGRVRPCDPGVRTSRRRSLLLEVGPGPYGRRLRDIRKSLIFSPDNRLTPGRRLPRAWSARRQRWPHPSRIAHNVRVQSIWACWPKQSAQARPKLGRAATTLTILLREVFEDENTSEGLKANPDGPDAEPVGPSPLRAQDESDCRVNTLAGSGPTSQPFGMVKASTWSPTLEAVWSSEVSVTTPPKNRVMARCAVHSPQAASRADGERRLPVPSFLVPSYPRTYSRRIRDAASPVRRTPSSPTRIQALWQG
uniref:Uncharacterized protein n=1 Tax=Setaria viridis TaxID=4556 RepID=A0A4U6SZR4_SETVI|nr:hypothetical protein SEVIR_9G243966v2 [Setaria viridis]